MCTVQAPHWPMPQPNLGPVIPRLSRSVQRSGVSASTSASRTLPLTLSLKAMPPSRLSLAESTAARGPSARKERYVVDLPNGWELRPGVEALRLEGEGDLAALGPQDLLHQARAEAGGAGRPD